MTDLAGLATAIGIEALDVSDAADALVRAINDAVLDKVEGQATAGATGLAIYFPPEQELFDEAYDEIETPAAWNDFLRSYYGVGAAIPQGQRARFQGGDAAAAAKVSFGKDGLTITGLVDQAARANVAEAFIRYGIVKDDKSISYLGEEPASLAGDGSGQASGTFDLTSLIISDGDDRATGYVQLVADEASETFTIDVPMAYYAPGDEDGDTYQDALLSIVFAGGSGDVVSETYYAYDDENGTFGELTADPEGIIVPEILRVKDDGTEEWISTSDVGLFADLPNLQYDFTRLASGTRLSIELSIVDFGGNVDTISAVVTVP